MNWVQWIAGLVSATAGTVLAVSYYLHWSWRFTRPRLGMVAETAFFVMLVSAGVCAVAAIWRAHP